MSYFIYIKKSDGTAMVMDYAIDLNVLTDYQFFGVSDDKLYFESRKYVDGQWVPIAESEPKYMHMRRFSYPPEGDLLLALWRAMDAGILPKVPGFYDKIKEVNEQFPPT